MFLISGTYEGNFLRYDGRLKLPPDLSFFDMRNYKGAIPKDGETNLIIQKLQFRSKTLISSHLMVSLCVLARDRMGRNGFFACRLISPECSQSSLHNWFAESVGELYRYLRDDAPLADGAIAYLPERRASIVVDFSGLKSKLDPKRTVRLNVNWLSEQGFSEVHKLINERLIDLNSFTIICGDNLNFNDDVVDRIYDWHEEAKLRELDKKREFKELKRRQVAAKDRQLKEDRFWEALYKLAHTSCMVLMSMLALFYFIVSMFKEPTLDGFDPLLFFSGIAALIALGRIFFTLFVGFRDHY